MLENDGRMCAGIILTSPIIIAYFTSIHKEVLYVV